MKFWKSMWTDFIMKFWKSMWTDFILGAIASSGLWLYLHHVTSYGASWHWAPANHGLYGAIAFVVAVVVLIIRHPPKK